MPGATVEAERLAADRGRLEEELAALRDGATAERSVLQGELARVRGALAVATAEQHALAASLTEAQAERERAAEALAQASADRDAAVAALALAEQRHDAREADVAAARDQRDGLAETSRAAVAARLELELEVAGLTAERDLVAARLDELVAETEALRAALDGTGEGPSSSGAPHDPDAPRPFALVDPVAASALRSKLDGLAFAAGEPGEPRPSISDDLAAAAARLRQGGTGAPAAAAEAAGAAAAAAAAAAAGSDREAVDTPDGSEAPHEQAAQTAAAAGSDREAVDTPDGSEAPHEQAAQTAAAPVRVAAPVRAAAPGAPGAAPQAPAAVAARPWLRDALVALAAEDPAAAARLVVALLPVQGLRVRRPLAYDLRIDGAPSVRVAAAPGDVLVQELEPGTPPRRPYVAVTGGPAALAALVGGGAPRALAADVAGRRWRLRSRLLRELGRPVSLAEVATSGAVPEPEALLRALAHAIDPDWVQRDAAIAVDAGGRLRVLLRAGRPIAVAADDGTPADATLTVPPAGLVPALAGVPPQAGAKPRVSGSHAAVAHLVELVGRAQA